MDAREKQGARIGAWAVACGLFSTISFGTWPTAIAVSPFYELWLTRFFLAVGAFSLYMAFAEAWDLPLSSQWNSSSSGASNQKDSQARPQSKSRLARMVTAAAFLVVLAGVVAGIEATGIWNRTHSIGSESSTTITLSAPNNANLANLKGDDAISGDGKYLAAAGTGSNQSKIYVWVTATGAFKKNLLVPDGGSVGFVCFESDDNYLVVLSYSSTTKENTIYRVPLSGGNAAPISEPFPTSLNWAISAGGSTLAVESSSGNGINMTDLTDGATSFIPLNDHVGWVRGSLELSNQGNTLIVSDKKGIAYVVDTSSHKTDENISFYSGAYLLYPALSPDGATVLAPTKGNGVQLWPVVVPGSSPPTSITPNDSKWSMSNQAFLYSSDGEYIMTFTQNGTSENLWNVSSRSYVTSVPGLQDNPYAVLLGPGGRQLVSGVGYGTSAYSKLYVQNIRSHGVSPSALRKPGFP